MQGDVRKCCFLRFVSYRKLKLVESIDFAGKSVYSITGKSLDNKSDALAAQAEKQSDAEYVIVRETEHKLEAVPSNTSL